MAGFGCRPPPRPRDGTGTAHHGRDGLLDPTRPRGPCTITVAPTMLLPAIQPRSGVLTLRSVAVEYSVYTTIIERLLYCWRGRPGVIVHSLLTPSGPPLERPSCRRLGILGRVSGTPPNVPAVRGGPRASPSGVSPCRSWHLPAHPRAFRACRGHDCREQHGESTGADRAPAARSAYPR